MNQKDFFNVDWTKIPEPKLDVNLLHLNNFKISDIELNSTDNKIVNIAKLKEITVIYIYPMTVFPEKHYLKVGMKFQEQEGVHLNLVLLEIIFLN